MTATAHQVASVHIAGINASRRKCGLAPLTLAEVASQFADLDRPAPRASVAPTTAVAADSMWGSIVQKLNASVPASRAPVASGHPSPEISDGDGRVDAVVDWSALARNLNASAGLATPARSRR